MTTISIIGSGNMATAIGTRAAKHGHTIELMSRNRQGSGTRRPDRQRSRRRHVRRNAAG
jgi:predicted dinucleotide-binding enzyme